MQDYDRFLADIPFPRQELDRLSKRAWILEYGKRHARVAEIGVFRGHFAEIILAKLDPSVFYMVDTWTLEGEFFGYGVADEYANLGKLTTQQAKDDARRRVNGFRRPDRSIELLEMKGVDFFTMLSERGERLDVVYLDTTHEYADTLRELSAAADVLADDGVIIGDDWHTNPQSAHFGVLLAVNDFVRESAFDVISAGSGNQYCLRRRQS
ncbi:MAG TPA: class I SAM-dependent methyltransferase [Phycisphaerae bacterium]|nr:class I SAM-dependent methyltransferase [Phycisphaerae bacterium]